jgi:hypothetical protein
MHETQADSWMPPDAETLPPEQPEPEYGPGDASDDKVNLAFLDDDLADFLKKPTTGKSREYAKKVNAFLNTAMRFCVQQPKLVPDGAAIVAHGGKFAKACGDLADADEYAAKFLDIVTSPENPYLMFAVAAIPFVSQLIRNHEPELQQVPDKWRARKRSTRAERKAARQARPGVEMNIPLINRKITLKLPVKFKLGYGRSQTVDPQALAIGVFSHPKVVRELEKRGIKVASP